MERQSTPSPPPGKSWSIYGRTEITKRYEILGCVGAGAYSDVYRGRRLADGVIVALKEIHDYQSAIREIEALQLLGRAPNVVSLLEYFWREDEDAVLVLEFLPTDLASVIREAKRAGGGGLAVAESKQWMLQVLRGVDACHASGVVHRDLKPSNLLISAEGVLKLADFGQARILREHGLWSVQQAEAAPAPDSAYLGYSQGQTGVSEEDYQQEVDGMGAKFVADENETEKETSIQDVDASCVATCSTGDVEDDTFKGSYSYEADEGGEVIDEPSELTSCVGTRWFRAPELLYGSTNYGEDVDLWSLGCIFAELLSLEPLFPGTSDIDQLERIMQVLGDVTEETFPGCSILPDYGKIFFLKVERPAGLAALLPGRSAAVVSLVGRLLHYLPSSRASAAELLQDTYFREEPLPAPLGELRVPSTSTGQDESSAGYWCHYKNLDSDSDMEDLGAADVAATDKGFSIRFP